MTNYNPGDVVLIAFPYVTAARKKKRPALVLLDTGDADILAARITTQIHQAPHDVKLTKWQSAGLLAPSVVRLHKLATLEKTLVERKLGKIQPEDRKAVADALRRICSDWRTSFSASP